MKKKIVCLILSLAMIMSFAVPTFAQVLPDNSEGTTLVAISEEDSMEHNYGIVEKNEGEIENNYGETKENEGTIDLNVTDPQDPSAEVGKVDVNKGSILNNGDDAGYGLVVENAEEGVIQNNVGIVNTNNGFIVENGNLGTVDENNGTIGDNKWIVTENKGEVTENNGTVKTNAEEGRVETNYSKVTSNEGTVVYNGEDGNVETNAGTVSDNSGTVDVNAGIISGNNALVNTNAENGTIEANNELAIVTENHGTVNSNDGSIESNDGTVVLNNGSVLTNDGSIETNEGIVSSNNGEISCNNGAVTENKGIIDQNNADMAVNEGTILENNATIDINARDGVVTNSEQGNVGDNYGIMVDSEGTTYVGVVFFNNEDETAELGQTIMGRAMSYKAILGDKINKLDKKGYTTLFDGNTAKTKVTFDAPAEVEITYKRKSASDAILPKLEYVKGSEDDVDTEVHSEAVAVYIDQEELVKDSDFFMVDGKVYLAYEKLEKLDIGAYSLKIRTASRSYDFILIIKAPVEPTDEA